MPKHKRVAVKLDLDWPYKRHTGIFAGTQQYAREHGWLYTVDEFVEDTLVMNKKSIPYDGIIARATTKLALRAARLKIPLVNVLINCPVWKRLPCVFADCFTSGRLRAEHLLSRGLRRFAALILENDRSEAEELQTFSDTVAEAGCQCQALTIRATPATKNWKRMKRKLDAWMDGWELPIGVFTGTESNGRIIAQACRTRGWRVPEDVAIIAGRNELSFCEGLRPTLTSIEFGFERIGYEAAALLDKLMKGGTPPKQPILIPPQELVVRESTDFYAVDDPLIAAALKFIATHCHRDIGQHDVARAVSTEVRTLQRRFQKFLNYPIASEIRRVRIERAKRELAHGTRSIAEIARDVGFNSPMRLYEVFRREVGVPPSQYRAERQLN